MRTYLRNRTAGGTYFFTVNLAQRRGNRLLLEHVGALRAAFRRTCLERPFTTIAWVVLPEHLHCLWRLPAGDDDRSEEHTSELQSLMRISHAVFCLKKKK